MSEVILSPKALVLFELGMLALDMVNNSRKGEDITDADIARIKSKVDTATDAWMAGEGPQPEE